MSSTYFIDKKISKAPKGASLALYKILWVSKVVYSRQRDSWNLLRQQHASSTLPWCVLGDFNNPLQCFENRIRSVG